MKTGILWDLDGTLLDTLQDLMDATNYALGQFGCPARSLEEIRCFVGNGAARLIHLALPGKSDDPDEKAVLDCFRSYYDAHCQDKTAPYAGIPEALSRIGQDYPMAIVSNKPDSAAKQLCAVHFPGIYARGESTDCPRKPDPAMVRKTMERLGVERCIYVGDSEVDVATAKNAGVSCLSVLWGFRDRATLESVGAEHFCRTPAELYEAVKRLEEENGK